MEYHMEYPEFRAWVESFGPLEEVGRIGNFLACPVARFLTHKYGPRPRIGVSWNNQGAWITVTQNGQTLTDALLDTWVWRLLRGIDLGLAATANGMDQRRRVRAARLLWLLDGLWPEVPLDLSDMEDDNPNGGEETGDAF